MTQKTKKPKLSRADLERKIVELEAQLASAYHFADANLSKAGQKHMMGSGVLLRLHANGGREIIPPVMIKDGLSDETIAAIRADLDRSYDLAIQFKPSGAQK